MALTTTEEIDLIRTHRDVWVRPMFELLDADTCMGPDAARWPEPFTFHDLDDQEAM